jgi:hypothetical protein
VYLVNPGEGCSFVVAARLDWATLRIDGHEESPLLLEDKLALQEYVERDIYYM